MRPPLRWRQARPAVDYAPLAEAWRATGLQAADARVVAALVMRIRQSKLPDPLILPNAGSFFKNPTVSNTLFKTLKSQFPNIVGYPNGQYKTKVAAGWLIEEAGWKGYKHKDAGVYKNQALVLVNYGQAKGQDILKLSQDIQASVQQKFGIALEAEVNII